MSVTIRRLGPWRIRRARREAAAVAGLVGPDGAALNVTSEMTLRYAALASPTLRSAYDGAVGKLR